MKGSTLHRSGLTKEKMGVLASLTQPEKKSTRTQLSQYYKATKSRELDLLWGGAHKSMQKVRNVAKLPTHRTPIVYISIGFVAGVLFMSLVTLMISVFSMSTRDTEMSPKASKVEVISEAAAAEAEVSASTEKYIVKKGDTLNGIAYRFYGKYSEEKINEIQKINNIKNPASLSIGQELIIPVSQGL
jgi:LysM repeat protein